MENLEKIVAALLVFIITSVLAYLFRMRQLYVLTPKLYKHAPISTNGSLCEIIVFNKGNQVEENIKINLDPDLKAELLASSSADIRLSGSIIEIDRLHKNTEASAILMVEHGFLNSTRITSFSSKGTKGNICSSKSSVYPNFAKMFSISVLVIGFLIASFTAYDKKIYDRFKDAYVEYKLNYLYQQGWSRLTEYYGSDLSKSYTEKEFPVRLIKKISNNEAEFEVINKTAGILKAGFNMSPSISFEDNGWMKFSSFGPTITIEVSPLSSKTFIFSIPVKEGSFKSSQLEVRMFFADEYISKSRLNISN